MVTPRTKTRNGTSGKAAPLLVTCLAGTVVVTCGRSPGPHQQMARESAAPGPAVRQGASARPRERPRPRPGKRPAPPPVVTVTEAAQILFPGARRRVASKTVTSWAGKAALRACRDGKRPARIRCLVARRYERDARAARLARAVYDLTGTVVGLEPARRMDGGWRGKLRLVPALLVGRHRRHLKRIAVALRDIDSFFKGLAKHAKRGGAGRAGRGAAIRYRWTALAFKAFRSVGRATPSAYAWGWTVAYNVNGSLLRHQRGVRQTLFHELFHLNDRHHKDWSDRVLQGLHRRIILRCTRGRGKRSRLSKGCLKPYAPHRTTVRGGVYYAFHPESGVGEYGAELAVRYFLEQRGVLSKSRRRPAPFKCRTPENARAWRLIAAEFFGGVDLVPACR